MLKLYSAKIQFLNLKKNHKEVQHKFQGIEVQHKALWNCKQLLPGKGFEILTDTHTCRGSHIGVPKAREQNKTDKFKLYSLKIKIKE